MNERMRHRGPDASGVYANGPALLAHRRLSILDLSEAGRQPMSNGVNDVHIVFNGEIYNYRELRERVDHYTFRSETDTEVLLHLYEEYGTECLQYLRGMFAFAIWDETRERLFLARDRLGQKPLYIRSEGDTFWFGSTIRTVLADDEVEAIPDLPALREFLTYQYVPHPRTGFQGISRLGPGEYMTVEEDGLTRDQYWSLSFADQSDSSERALRNQLREQMYESTRLRMRSDVPVGVFLSGGIDSSIVTSVMADISDEPVQTYSIGFDEKAYDELDYARTVADTYGTNHHEYTVTPDSVEILPELVSEYEMPFGDPSAVPTYYVSQVASDDISVVLTGDAGDENFAGYDRYRWDRIARRLSSIPNRVRDLGTTVLDRTPDSDNGQNALRYLRRGLKVADEEPVKAYAELICHSSGEETAEIWDGSTPEDELAYLRTAFAKADGNTRLDQLMHVDFQTYLPDDLLVKVDRASMAHSLEVRSPFLDHELVEFAARIPAHHKYRRGEGKHLLKQAFANDLPQSVLTREKSGFSVPVGEWLRGPLRESTANRLASLSQREPFNRRGITNTWEAHLNGQDHAYRLWDLLILEEWYRQFIDG